MKLDQIKAAVESGKTVHVGNAAYIVVKDVMKTSTQWLIKCTLNNHCIGLTHADGITLNAKEEDFFIAKTMAQYSVIAHMNTMLQSMNAITRMWDEYRDDIDPMLTPEYPFNQSFDDLCVKVEIWLTSAKQQ